MSAIQSKLIQVIVSLFILIILLTSRVDVHAVTTAPPDGNLLKDIDAPVLDYPKTAWDESWVGEVTLMFDVSDEGYVENRGMFKTQKWLEWSQSVFLKPQHSIPQVA